MEKQMTRWLRALVTAGGLAVVALTAGPASAQQPGAVLKVHHQDSPASMSIHEEATYSTVVPMMGVYNNLVMYEQDVAQNSMQSIVPDLAASWSWSEDGTELSFKLRRDVKWHDGRPFTAADVKCTFDLLLGKAKDKLRLNPRKAWYRNLDEVTAKADDEAIFHLHRPQPALVTLLASGYSPIYPCHVPPRELRSHPIGTGPFKFVEFKPNERITVARNPDYWKPGRPYLDGIEYKIVPNRSTAILAFVAGKFDLIWVGIPLLQDVKSQVPQATCDVVMDNNSRDLIVNRAVPPFDNIELRQAMALSLDRRAFIDILTEGQGAVGGSILPPPDGVWGMPPEVLHTLPGYRPDVETNRVEARAIMQKLGYGPVKRLSVTLSTRNVEGYRDAAVIAISQLREIHIDGQLELIETANWYPRVTRKDYTVGVTVSEGGLDEPDQKFYETYVCGAERNYSGYCNDETDRLIDRQSMEANAEKRRKLVWEVERRLAEDASRPVLLYSRFATCMQPRLKGLTTSTNSRFNGWRMEDLWLDR